MLNSTSDSINSSSRLRISRPYPRMETLIISLALQTNSILQSFVKRVT